MRPIPQLFTLPVIAASAGIDVRTLLLRVKRGGLVPAFRCASIDMLFFSEQQRNEIVFEFKISKSKKP